MARTGGGVGSWYAWVVAACCFLAGVAVMCGIYAYTYNVSYVAAEFQVTAADLAIATSMYGGLSAGLAFAVGAASDKFGARFIVSIGMIALGAILFLIGMATSSAIMFIILYPCAGACASVLGSAIIPKLISNWFAPNMRAKGMMCFTVGGSLSAAVFGIVIPMLIINLGWRGCFEVLGAIAIVCGVVFLLLCRNEPALLNTVPFGSPPGTEVHAVARLSKEEKASNKASNRRGLAAVAKMPITWIFGVMYIFWMLYGLSSAAFQSPAILESGYDITIFGLINTVQMVCTMVSQLIFSSLCDRFASRKKFLGTLCIVGGLMWVMYYFVLGMGVQAWVLVVYCGIIGLISGHTAIIYTMMAEMYPPHLRGAGSGLITTLTLIGTFFGPVLGAVVVTAAGGANVAVYLFSGSALVISGLITWIFIPNTGGKYGDPLAEQAEAEAAAQVDETSA